MTFDVLMPSALTAQTLMMPQELLSLSLMMPDAMPPATYVMPWVTDAMEVWIYDSGSAWGGVA